MDFSHIPSDASTMSAEWVHSILGASGTVTVEEIGIEFGFGGTTFLVSSTGDASMPRTAVVKLATAERTRREIDFYENCAPKTPIDTPAFLGGDTDADGGVVVLEHLGGMKQGDVLAGCTESQFLTLARTLGRLHGRWWGAQASDLDPLRVNPKTPSMIERRLEVASERHPIPARLGAALSGLGDRVQSAHETLYQGSMTLAHRDFHLDNVLFDAAERPMILDWQNAAIGPPAVDVARIFVDCRPPALSAEVVDRALREYLAALPGDDAPSMLELRRQIALAFYCQLALTMNWLGRAEPGSPGSRMAALEGAVLPMLDEAGAHFIVD